MVAWSFMMMYGDNIWSTTSTSTLTFVKSQETANANSFGSSKLGRRDQGCPALIAQATRLLGKVLRHTSHNYRSELDLEDQCLEVGSSLRQRQENEFSQLGRTIASLIDAAETEARKWAVPIEEQLMICYR